MQLSQTLTVSDNDDAALAWQIPSTHRFDTGCGTSLHRANINQEDLIFSMIDQGMQDGDQRDPLAIGEVTAKHRELDVITLP